ncbi:hypothetical protein [Arenibaculum pallidiluteum]|uniref:hypothetical protein n=1 Tax=Arenibaculum pallidiluteum TaxID=2812559 RepID=UPI001A95DE6D|nr:hypothetical protein [Arenibaculum pallidiluteum]
MRTIRCLLAALGWLALVGASGAACAGPKEDTGRRAVRTVVAGRLDVPAGGPRAFLALHVSADWTRPLPGIRRAVVVLHGRLRNADTYRRIVEAVLAEGGPAAMAATLVVAPQFLAPVDAAANALPAEILRWAPDSWQAGAEADGPAPVSAFEALDAVMARLADRALFPDLAAVVIAGHSGGAQLAQRYAAVGRGLDRLEAAGRQVRTVLANPGSYLYFGPERPDGAGGFALPPREACPGYDTWRYGLGDPPRYLDGVPPGRIEAAYAGRQVVYLLGAEDRDPEHHSLDRSCAARLQGPHRLARGWAFYRHLAARHPRLSTHRLIEVPGAEHDAREVLTSVCGRAALMDRAGCTPE